MLAANFEHGLMHVYFLFLKIIVYKKIMCIL